MTDLDYTLEIMTPSGWLLLEDEANGYTLGSETMNEVSTSRRDRQVAGQWVEGSFTTASVKENETVPVQVWVEANTPAILDARLQVLKDSFDQLSYQMREVFGGATRLWSCMPGSYSIASSGPLRFAVEAAFSVQVPRLPSTAVSYA